VPQCLAGASDRYSSREHLKKKNNNNKEIKIIKTIKIQKKERKKERTKGKEKRKSPLLVKRFSWMHLLSMALVTCPSAPQSGSLTCESFLFHSSSFSRRRFWRVGDLRTAGVKGWFNEFA
jgi:hypothetical protein